MTDVRLEREGNVFVLRFAAGENGFRPASLAAWHAALDEVESAGSPAALVTTGSSTRTASTSSGCSRDRMRPSATPTSRRSST